MLDMTFLLKVSITVSTHKHKLVEGGNFITERICLE